MEHPISGESGSLHDHQVAAHLHFPPRDCPQYFSYNKLKEGLKNSKLELILHDVGILAIYFIHKSKFLNVIYIFERY